MAPLVHGSRGFTLIELLVVISIIAILAALLLPTVALVRDSARSSICGSNLRQIGICVGGYLADFGTVPWGQRNNPTYKDWRQDLADFSDQSLPSKAWSCPTVSNGPAVTSNYIAHQTAFPCEWINFGPNARFRPANDRDMRPDFAVIYDGAQYIFGINDAFPIAWAIPWPWGNWADNNPTAIADFGDPQDGLGGGSQHLRFRHRGACNHLFGDLHVELLRNATRTQKTYLSMRNGRKWDWESWIP